MLNKPLPSVNSSNLCEQQVAFTCIKSGDNLLWHLSLGYPSSKIVHTVLRTEQIECNMSDFPTVCEACELEKTHKIPF